MENRVINNVFTDEEVLQIKYSIEAELDSRTPIDWDSDLEMSKPAVDTMYKVHPEMGRLVAESVNTLPKPIMDKIHSIAERFMGSPQFIGATYCEYSGKYGRPLLPMHVDRGHGNTICLDYQLDSNISWPIVINDEEFQHEDNDIIVFKTTKELHGRPDIMFSEKDYVKVIFFYFDNGDTE